MKSLKMNASDMNTKPQKVDYVRWITLVLEIVFSAIIMLLATPLVIIFAGVFQTWDEWEKAIQKWERELKDHAKR